MLTEKEKQFHASMPLGKLMGAILRKYFGALSKKLEVYGADRHFSTLVAIDNADQKCTQQYLSDLLNFDKVSMVRMLDYLVERKLITRTVNPDDRREHLIQLTPKAKRIMPEIHAGIKEMNATALKGINKQDQEMFYYCLSTILKNIENLPVNKVDIKLKKK
ncbi:MAG: MarR family winged helix-turn-helix transcriptional regulator [Bacteroidia bacterium]